MSDTRTLSHSFNGGILSEQFFGQVEDAKFKAGLSRCLNAICLPHGPVSNRGGSKYVVNGGDMTKEIRVIPFAFSVTQTYAMEIGEKYIRFHTMGGTLGPSSTDAWNTATSYGQGDTVSYIGVNYYSLQSHSNRQPTTQPLYWYPMPTGPDYFEMPTLYLSADLASLHYVQSNDVMTITHPEYPTRKITRFVPVTAGAYTFKIEDEIFGSSLVAPVVGATTYTYTPGVPPGPVLKGYQVTAVDANGLEESLPGQQSNAYANNELDIAGNTNLITWSAVTGAAAYNVYRDDGGVDTTEGHFSFIGSTGALSFEDNNKSPDISKSPPLQPEAGNRLSTAGNYAVEVSYFQQRKVFGGTINQPQRMVLTRTGTEQDLNYTIPTRDDDSIAFKAASRESSEIRHIVPLNALIVLTSAEEWTIEAAGGGAITPSSISLRTPSHIGSSNVRPVPVNNNIIFEANRGSHWHELAYSFDAGSYTTRDLTLRTFELFEGLNTIDMAYSRSPYPIVWGTSSNGRLIGMTYVPGENVSAFHEHETKTASGASSFKSMCVVPEGDYDYIYAVVEREINGATVKYIERYEPHVFDTVEDAFFVDSGVTLDIPITITGITQAVTAVVEAIGHGFTTGEVVDLRDIVAVANIPPATLTLMSSLNGGRFKIVEGVDADHFLLLTDDITWTTTPTAWLNATAYAIGDTVSNGGVYYYCKVAHTSSTGVIEPPNTGYWVVLSIDTSAYTAYRSGGTAREVVSTITGGLDHLIGETVSILANGAVAVDAVVDGSGDITLDFPASIVHVGLKIETEIELLPATFAIDAAFGVGLEKNVVGVGLQVYRSGGISVGPDLDNLTEVKQRTDEPYGSATRLITGLIDRTDIDDLWNKEGQVVIQQYHPLPLNLLSATLEVALGDS